MSPIPSQAPMERSGAAPARVLVVEDEGIVARDLAGALAELGYSVPATVATGEDAIARALDLHPDVVLMDIRLPGKIDGIEAASVVRQQHGIPVVFLTAHSDGETLRRAMLTEPVGYVVKPFSPPQLRCAIEIALHRRRLDAECERRVAEHIVELEAANRELENFTCSVARDLRSPLRGIDGLSRSLIDGHAADLGPEGVRRLEQVCETAGRMRDVIDNLVMLSVDDLLLLSRVSNAHPRRERVDLSAIAREVAAQLREAAPERAVRVVIEPKVCVQGDAELLRIVLESLLGNAWKFTGQTEHARIEFGAIDRDGCRTFFVRDNGAGFDMANAHRLFVSFGRSDPADRLDGSGFGLVVAQRAVHCQGGCIWAEGTLGRGATFYFTL